MSDQVQPALPTCSKLQRPSLIGKSSLNDTVLFLNVESRNSAIQAFERLAGLFLVSPPCVKPWGLWKDTVGKNCKRQRIEGNTMSYLHDTDKHESC